MICQARLTRHAALAHPMEVGPCYTLKNTMPARVAAAIVKIVGGDFILQGRITTTYERISRSYALPPTADLEPHTFNVEDATGFWRIDLWWVRRPYLVVS